MKIPGIDERSANGSIKASCGAFRWPSFGRPEITVPAAATAATPLHFRTLPELPPRPSRRFLLRKRQCADNQGPVELGRTTTVPSPSVPSGSRPTPPGLALAPALWSGPVPLPWRPCPHSRIPYPRFRRGGQPRPQARHVRFHDPHVASLLIHSRVPTLLQIFIQQPVHTGLMPELNSFHLASTANISFNGPTSIKPGELSVRPPFN